MIELKNVTKTFDDRKILDDLSLQIEQGEFIAIIGRSGEGKSVLLKHIIGLLKPDTGKVILDGTDITHLTGTDLQKVYHKCGYVFQFAALLDSLDVFRNVGIAALENGEDPEKVRAEVIKRVKSVGLAEDVITKYPDELSGGMRKRVGLARTLMMNPEIILYDEPTTGLDPISVRRIHELILNTHKEQKATSIVISHDPEIFNYVETVAMLYQGKILYSGKAKEIWDCDNPYIHQFIRGLHEGPIDDDASVRKK